MQEAWGAGETAFLSHARCCGHRLLALPQQSPPLSAVWGEGGRGQRAASRASWPQAPGHTCPGADRAPRTGCSRAQHGAGVRAPFNPRCCSAPTGFAGPGEGASAPLSALQKNGVAAGAPRDTQPRLPALCLQGPNVPGIQTLLIGRKRVL